MDKLRSLLALILVVATLFVFQTGCSPDNKSNGVGVESKANGTSDGGGGDIDLSTPEQIKEAVESARALMYDITFLNNFFTLQKFASLEGVCETEGFINLFAKAVMLPSDLTLRLRATLVYEIDGDLEILRGNLGINECLQKELDILKEDHSPKSLLLEPHYQGPYDPVERLKAPKQFLEYLRNIEITYAEKGACPANNNNHADASVSEYTREAKVCFSIKLLRRIPPSSLESHILGLWIHELAHMAGEKGEVLPTLLEKMAIKNYSDIKSKFKYDVLEDYSKDLDNISGYLGGLLSDASNHAEKGLSYECGNLVDGVEVPRTCLNRALDYLSRTTIIIGNFNKEFSEVRHSFDPVAGLLDPSVRAKYGEPMIEAHEFLSTLDRLNLFLDSSLERLTEIAEEAEKLSHQFVIDTKLRYKKNIFTSMDIMLVNAIYDPRNQIPGQGTD